MKSTYEASLVSLPEIYMAISWKNLPPCLLDSKIPNPKSLQIKIIHNGETRKYRITDYSQVPTSNIRCSNTLKNMIMVYDTLTPVNKYFMRSASKLKQEEIFLIASKERLLQITNTT